MHVSHFDGGRVIDMNCVLNRGFKVISETGAISRWRWNLFLIVYIIFLGPMHVIYYEFDFLFRYNIRLFCLWNTLVANVFVEKNSKILSQS